MEPALDSLDSASLTQLSLPTSKILHKEHRAPFALRLLHALRLFVQAQDAAVAAPDASPPSPALALNLEWATKLLHITPVLLQ